MRKVLNISLPSNMDTEIKVAVKKYNYGTTSEFFRDLFRQWKESELLKELDLGRREIVKKKGKILESLKDLG
jgi:Arc/MetJ-type ribon-helix-helix transcriptional regulator